ncbi:MAG TPA: ABC transporter permease [Polyangiaceae bacterium]|nr:ABC transporter permease [Polyangiaceae bacterium]
MAETATLPSRGALQELGGAVLSVASVVGAMAVLLGACFRRLASRDFDGQEFVRALYKMGVRSVPIVVVTALFTGGIMVIQAAPVVERVGAKGLLGWGAGFGTLREVGPLLTALMISGRVGANNTAELGTMAVTEQIDALRALAINPIGFLVVPRFLALVTTLFLSTVISDVLALLGAAFAGRAFLAVEPMSFYNGLTSGLLGFNDVAHGLSKSIVFGVVIGLSSCHFGIGTSGGAPGVGRAVNATVVVSAAGIFVLDYLVSFALG